MEVARGVGLNVLQYYGTHTPAHHRTPHARTHTHAHTPAHQTIVLALILTYAKS